MTKQIERRVVRSVTLDRKELVELLGTCLGAVLPADTDEVTMAIRPDAEGKMESLTLEWVEVNAETLAHLREWARDCGSGPGAA